ncbi:MAG: winged helix-turn-helix domain-containing protein [Minwuiales bacterium]|nr:winged helix-turn-helix domain-containing protein [Minwuiales bacterium]
MRLAFGDCVLDLDRRELRRDGAAVHARAKVFDVLAYLIANRDRVVSRDDLMAHAWPGLTVSDTTLSTCILGVRRAIGDDVGNPRFVKTLRGQGFRFIADVTTQDNAEAAGQSAEGRGDTGNGYAAHARDETLSIAVLPFANLNDDPKLDYLADGLSEDIIRELSRFKAFTVIAQSSSFQYRGQADDIRKIGAELRVDYVLEGSVRNAGDDFRATAQLIHAPTAKHVWAERFDGRIDDLLTLQDDIARTIVTNIAPEIDHEEIRRAARPPVGDLGAQEMAWRARALVDRARAEGDTALYGEGMEMAEAAATRDPQCRQAWWTIAFANYTLAFAGRSADQPALLNRAREAAEKLRALDRNDHSAYMALGWISYIEQDPERAMTYLDQALALNPNCTMTLMLSGAIATANGDAEAGYDYLTRAMRCSPRDVFLGFMLAAQAFACFALKRYAEGVELSRRAIQREPHAPANHAILAACLAETGDLRQAGAAIRAQRRINEKLLQLYLDRKRLPFRDTDTADRYVAALDRAADE